MRIDVKDPLERWIDHINVDPIQDLYNASEQLLDRPFIRLVIGRNALRLLLSHPDGRDLMIKFNVTNLQGFVTKLALMCTADEGKIIVGNEVYFECD